MEIYERIAYLRKDVLKMSQTQFAAVLGSNRDTISNIELNRLKFPEKMEPIYKLICKEFRVREEWLKNGEGEMFLKQTPMEEIMERLANIKLAKAGEDEKAAKYAAFRESLGAAFLNLTDEGCDVIIKLIEDMGFVRKDEAE